MLDDDHRERRRTPCHILAAAVLVGILVSPSTVSAGTLAGRLTDALTGTPVADADVRVLGTNRTTRTDDRGRWQFDLPPGTYRLHFVARLGGERHETRLVNQRVPQYKSAEAHLYTDYFLERGDPRLADPPGAPPSERPPPSTPHSNEPIRLPLPPADGRPGPGSLDLPGTPPASIRVARRKHPDRGCRGNPIVAIEKMSLEEYVRGVLPPEIGVFRNLSNIGQTYRAFAIAARSYGLWFRLRYGRGNRRRLGRSVPPHGYSWYHIGDTACEQRYSDNRLAITDRAVDAVSGRIMVRASDRDLLEKFEYAASCGAHGTRPAFQRSLVPDRPPDSACVNNWCGHDDCAGHEDNPQVPGSDSCLVRGMCQWGAASWSEAGKGWTWIVDHYQPNLDVRRIGDDRNRAVLTGYAYTDPSNILETALPGVEVTVDGRWSTRTDESGRYRLKRLPTETVDIVARKPGYQTGRRQKRLRADRTNWASVHLQPAVESADRPALDTGPAADTGADVGDSSPADRDGGDRRSADTADRSPGRRSTFGALVQPSPGVSPEGCSTAPNHPRSALWVVICLVGLAGRRPTA